jgi:CHASE3 domain sensor protein
MSSDLIIPPSAAKLARQAWLRVSGLLVFALLSAVALAFYGIKLHELSKSKDAYKDAEQTYHVRTQAIHRLSDMETAFNRYLLDANSANLDLLQSDKQKIEQLAQQDAYTQHGQLLQDLVASEKRWNEQVVQPLVEERRKLSAGQGLPEDFLAKYRAARQDLQVLNTEIAAENAHHQAQQTLQDTENTLRWIWLPLPLAFMLAIGTIWLGIGAVKSINHLKQAAESAGDEEEDDGHEPAENHEEAK